MKVHKYQSLLKLIFPYVNERAVKILVQKKLLKFHHFKQLSSQFPEGLVAFDFEAIGVSPLTDQTIEIGAVKIKNGEIDFFESFLGNHQESLPDDINQEIHGISHEMLKNAPDRLKTLLAFLDFCEGAVLLAHNAKFDIGYLLFGLKESLRKIKGKVYCSHFYAKEVLHKKVDNFKLITLAQYYGIDIENHHRALNDAIICLQVFAKLFGEDLGPQKLHKAHLFSLEQFDARPELPLECQILYKKIKQNHIVEINYSGGSHIGKFRPVKPRSLLLMPDGPVLYGYCFLSNIYKSFLIKKIKEIREPSFEIIQKYGSLL